ncbi:hypothetical protein NL505_27370, partial [Klebsiella pneumoniae]|nr:hypothetical protein [Klebsiella pneumoniae]
ANWVLLGVALVLSLGFAALSAWSTLSFADFGEQAAQEQTEAMLDGRTPEEAGLTEEQIRQQEEQVAARAEQQMTEGSGLTLPDGMSFGEYMA